MTPQPQDRPTAAKDRLSRPQREALAMLRRSAEHPSTDTGLLTSGPSIYDGEVDVAWINTATAKALSRRGLIEWGDYVGPEEGGYVLHLTEAAEGKPTAAQGRDRTPWPAELMHDELCAWRFGGECDCALGPDAQSAPAGYPLAIEEGGR